MLSYTIVEKGNICVKQGQIQYLGKEGVKTITHAAGVAVLPLQGSSWPPNPVVLAGCTAGASGDLKKKKSPQSL